MALLIRVVLVILLAYQCADVVNGAADENSLPEFVKNKRDLFGKLKEICYKEYNTRVVASPDLRNCRVTCATGLFHGLFGSGSTVSLKSHEPCDNDAYCDKGQCVYFA
uniref:Putative ixodes 8-cys protein n=1 Tax=Ixodes ricinus TaxID=34613 RepID=A0A0K8RLP3_IXORI